MFRKQVYSTESFILTKPLDTVHLSDRKLFNLLDQWIVFSCFIPFHCFHTVPLYRFASDAGVYTFKIFILPRSFDGFFALIKKPIVISAPNVSTPNTTRIFLLIVLRPVYTGDVCCDFSRDFCCDFKSGFRPRPVNYWRLNSPWNRQ